MKKVHKLISELCASAISEIVLIAPFMKREVVSYLAEEMEENVKLTCVTRWRPEEIFAGVSDLEVFDVVSHHKHGKLFLYPWLHAKYYRGDNRILVGSMNLTQRALGWTVPSNFELLISTDINNLELQEFEKKIFETAVEVDDYLLMTIKDAVERLSSIGYNTLLAQEDSSSDSYSEPSRWIPWCTAPDRLYNVYANFNTWELVSSAEKDARRDLSVLNVPSGLDRKSFEKFVAATLDQMPLINEIDRNTIEGLSDEEAISILTQKGSLVHSSDIHWKILKKWLTYFFPDRYRRRTETEVLMRSRII